MIALRTEVKEQFEYFNEVIKRAEKIAVFTRDCDLQKEQIEILVTYIDNLTNFKNENKEKYSEEELNLLLCLIISADAVQKELQMVISLKSNEMFVAWASLVQAQNNVSIVARNHPLSDGKYLNGYVHKLMAFEQTLFPKMFFSSVGEIIKKSICSYCKIDYEECEHIKGKMYMGELCVREIHEAELEEVSIVENPANKMCIQIEEDFEGKTVDSFTLVKRKENSDGK